VVNQAARPRGIVVGHNDMLATHTHTADLDV
jgi:hypothetical protein